VVLEGIRGPAISFHDYVFPETTSTGNVFNRLTVDGAQSLFDVRHRSFGTELHGGSVTDVESYAAYEGGFGESDLEVTIDGTIFADVGFTPP
jgi:hypothetical protein